MLRISNIALPLDYTTETMLERAVQKLHIDSAEILDITLSSRKLDTTDKAHFFFNASFLVSIQGDELQLLSRVKDKTITREVSRPYSLSSKNKLDYQPIIVGCGPAGMFAALVLAEAGACPILIEQGEDVEKRKRKVDHFWRTGILDTTSNVQYGEGGAGTFSDGKLKVGLRDARKCKILLEMVEAGAPDEILFSDTPHLGTDTLFNVVKNIRTKIQALGGEIRFSTTFTDIIREHDHIAGVRAQSETCHFELPTQSLILAIGNSARTTFEHLHAHGILMEQRPFAIGVRIEHPQALINSIQHGTFAGHPCLGAASYRMVVHLQNKRGVYTFCMCPGGVVVASASEENQVVTNGMSLFARDGKNANTALLVTVDKNDLGSDHPLAGIAFQRSIERAAFNAGGGDFYAPVQRLEDFMHKRQSNFFGTLTPTYLPGTRFSEVDSYFPSKIADSLRQAITEMGEWMPGFAFPNALLTGAETRTSSPVRITRNDNLQAIGIKGLYPCGEGAGYSGGILSAAVDGMKCAEKILGN